MQFENPLTTDKGLGATVKDLLPVPATDPADLDVGGQDSTTSQQIYDVKATPYPPPGGLDLNIADDEEFSPDKMRANIERLYMTVGVGLLAAWKHVARLRSWRERKRTTYFAAAYFIAWSLDILTPLLSAVLLALIGSPRAREILFPPVPVALVDSKTGSVQKPMAGVLGSHDSATGAPENHKGEAVEQEASNFVSGIASVALSSAAGKHPQGDPDSDDYVAVDAAPDPTSLAASTADAKDKASGRKTGPKHDKTKVPMETVIWTKMRPIMHTIGTIADTWERLAKGSQLTLTLLRHGEANHGPLLHPTHTTHADQPAELTSQDLDTSDGSPPLNATPSELNAAITPSPSTTTTHNPTPTHNPAHHHPTTTNKILSLFKGTTRGAVKTAIGTDTVRAKAGSAPAKNRLGVIPPRKDKDKDTTATSDPDLSSSRAAVAAAAAGPAEFEARHNGHKGTVYLSTGGATVPVVAFGLGHKGHKGDGDGVKAVWSVPVADVVEVRKIGGYGWKAKLVVGWSMEREVKDGLVIRTVVGEEYKITAVPLRDELFNRLVAVGGQKWEAW
ncbi:hypothetical protein CHGG_10063 [Chaetomium globosum CBS 148.51]|uniref:Uncharacterized protein n=1 Tax=Chaetomium globosum (strain ATCC 6205 / CBS 148.51 / DSM 1962 / NBRC 6347 / NRRL 1970) TaxID=306901 RepID=Q2GPP1_CHAGB|nr:uncharacterized protein CHGG_10063 [Chaetomium globosum CBS 148.51]EAQ83659.1 hypothetical protein CHGG_10063 [Chaetomium globosum CBS 148.51]